MKTKGLERDIGGRKCWSKNIKQLKRRLNRKWLYPPFLFFSRLFQSKLRYYSRIDHVYFNINRGPGTDFDVDVNCSVWLQMWRNWIKMLSTKNYFSVQLKTFSKRYECDIWKHCLNRRPLAEEPQKTVCRYAGHGFPAASRSIDCENLHWTNCR